MPSSLRQLVLATMIFVASAVAACSPAPTGPTFLVQGTAMAGPTCPVQPAAPLPGQCAERPVAGAVLIIADATGHEVARLTTAADGSFSTHLAAGSYILSPQPVPGFIGGARPIDFSVSSGAPSPIAVQYDTGIR